MFVLSDIHYSAEEQTSHLALVRLDVQNLLMSLVSSAEQSERVQLKGGVLCVICNAHRKLLRQGAFVTIPSTSKDLAVSNGLSITPIHQLISMR